MWPWQREDVTPVRAGDSPLSRRELHLIDAAEAAVSSWEVYRDDLRGDLHSLRRHEDALVSALERLDGALDPYHLPSDRGE